jgi:hypothetical protein
MDMMRPIVFNVEVEEPSAPSPLAGAAVGSQAVLTWTDTTPAASSLGNPENEIGFRIERSINGGPYTSIGTALANATTYVDGTAMAASTTYSYRVFAYNADGDSPASNTWVLPVTVTGVTANVIFPVTSGTSVTWTATATGGVAPLAYQFWLYNVNSGTWTLAQPYGSSNSYTSTPAAGTYWIQVWVRNSGSGTVYDAWLGSSSFTISGVTPLTITGMAANVAFPVAAGTSVTWTATATGGAAPYTYQFWVYSASSGTWTLVQPYSASNSYTSTPGQGTYSIQVWVRSAGSTFAYDAWRESNFTVGTALPVLTSLTENVTFPVRTGATITWTATATGGTGPLTYEFWLYSASSGTWTLGQPYSTSNTYTSVPAAGTYWIQAWVRNAGSTAAYDSWIERGSFTISPPPPTITGMAANVAFPVAAGTSVTWTATATGGAAPYTYQFWVYSASSGTWTLVQPYSASNSYTSTPGQGTYSIQVWVRSAGSTFAYDAWRESNFTVGTALPVLTSLTENVTFPVRTGATITWTATATGGTGPLTYEFWLYSASSGTWTLGQPYSTSNTYTSVPAAGTYWIQAWVRNAGSTAAYDSWIERGSFTISPPPPTITGLLENVTFPVAAGTPITWTATATGGAAPYTYQFWLYSVSSGTWTVAQPYGAGNTYTLAPAAGTYWIQVWVRSAGSTFTYDAWRGSNAFIVK